MSSSKVTAQSANDAATTTNNDSNIMDVNLMMDASAQAHLVAALASSISTIGSELRSSITQSMQESRQEVRSDVQLIQSQVGRLETMVSLIMTHFNVPFPATRRTDPSVPAPARRRLSRRAASRPAEPAPVQLQAPAEPAQNPWHVPAFWDNRPSVRGLRREGAFYGVPSWTAMADVSGAPPSRIVSATNTQSVNVNANANANAGANAQSPNTSTTSTTTAEACAPASTQGTEKGNEECAKVQETKDQGGNTELKSPASPSKKRPRESCDDSTPAPTRTAAHGRISIPALVHPTAITLPALAPARTRSRSPSPSSASEYGSDSDSESPSGMMNVDGDSGSDDSDDDDDAKGAGVTEEIEEVVTLIEDDGNETMGPVQHLQPTQPIHPAQPTEPAQPAQPQAEGDEGDDTAREATPAKRRRLSVDAEPPRMPPLPPPPPPLYPLPPRPLAPAPAPVAPPPAPIAPAPAADPPRTTAVTPTTTTKPAPRALEPTCSPHPSTHTSPPA
ncbi:hypothetical protein SERLA73DRAFT_75394 [Serpula lacrymans var. lacrymans S7.3]|uniref:Uncharacterized protein n=1 Tax=Serpula lacrymans var. lacrymans (strain S7.3) TaxID=936435 RepID=F8Q3J2_SERL3|nr:hypothetical protein SERLA73DRAFT_75394 [Serpula lacrymans var. lacrymans S7.3]